MITQEETGINQKAINEIVSYAKMYNVDRVVLFGSRARGDYKKTSDIDLAFWGGRSTDFILAVDEETNTLLSFDIVDMEKCSNEELIASITMEGKMIYEKV